VSNCFTIRNTLIMYLSLITLRPRENAIPSCFYDSMHASDGQSLMRDTDRTCTLYVYVGPMPLGPTCSTMFVVYAQLSLFSFDPDNSIGRSFRRLLWI